MRLKQIKLAGFKSFVDVTTVPFPAEMTAIVGPNGCGKSNIIDAVRWVLGESSAKNLRGDSMTDVIFNGSSSRKPIGQASVELVFDNTEQRLTGSMADRSQISIRRIVNRDSQNTYFLNGSKCRRKDITDIFLGTGLGPRSYAIIEQGTISKLIESKPQELRVFLEEAAGVSKYKERRRETENRIKHTRENLARLTDIRQELAIQIEKLHGQAQAAIRFKELKAKERLLKAEVTVLRWQECQRQLQVFKNKQTSIEQTLQQLNDQQRSAELSVLATRATQDGGNNSLSELQQLKLNLNTQITRLEQNTKYAKQQQLKLSQQSEQLQQSITDLTENIKKQAQEKQQLCEKMQHIIPEVRSVTEQLELQQQQYNDIQHRQHAWQQHWDNFSQQRASYEKLVNVTNTKVEATNQLLAKSEQRLDAIQEQLKQVDLSALSVQLQSLQSQHSVQNQLVEALKVERQQLQSAQTQLQANLTDKVELKESLNQQYLSLRVERDALLGTFEPQTDWQIKQQQELRKQNIDIKQTLLAQLQVNSPWENAVEMVLGSWLQASCVDTWPTSYIEESGLLVKENLDCPVQQGSLAAQVNSNNPFIHLLNSVITVDSVELAQNKGEQLSDGQSVICPQGHWYGKSWLKVGSLEQQSGLIKRNAKVNELKQKIKIKAQQVEQTNQVVLQLEKQKQQLLSDVAQQSLTLSQGEQTQVNLKQQISLLAQEIAFKKQQQLSLTDELQQQQLALTAELASYEVLLKELETLKKAKQGHQQNSDTLQMERKELHVKSQQLHQKIQQINQNKHQLSLQQEQINSALQLVTRELERDNKQLLVQQNNNQELQVLQQNSQQPMVDDEKNLQHFLKQSAELDKQQQALSSKLSDCHQQISQFNSKQQSLTANINKNRELLAKVQIDSESYKVRQKTALEQLTEMQQDLEQILAGLPSGAKESQWQLQIVRIAKNISQLGAINLAAVDEYETQAQRKLFLDTQNNDLEAALATLEAAIHKIDKESKQKFKNTFDQVNADLKVLFPKVFGGGSAYLDLTGEDLLDTGVTIMARPPGKKNSTIHLLSGGEKALTALSLVFAIFRLNPAPFCMLDEVDAPLDDANVGRFCNLVKEMSQTVQFIYISHNKIAMEMASHLTGVTMHEPGVSRMVAVDIDEAMSMAEAS